ncbi:follistatin-related protein 5-like [Lingula anatina]|uniref:Follistatin-related protein 5-like n=1 Tax=Lingula anatina TaxID=7574 RepID=A0A1S3HRU2_LINAN|nr:follistatin-related protein 5-like [Lingula anatina]|eukprot:XP_013388750.1 follistatin-related protein 5-like [Lingula anatina]
MPFFTVFQHGFFDDEADDLPKMHIQVTKEREQKPSAPRKPHVDKSAEEKKDDETVTKDPCAGVWCQLGRACKVNADGFGKCECGDEKLCLGHHKKVCGTNRVWYPSHCELHRQACVLRQHIRIDHTEMGCVEQESRKKEASKKESVDKKSNKEESTKKDVPKPSEIKMANKKSVKKDLEFQKPNEVHIESHTVDLHSVEEEKTSDHHRHNKHHSKKEDTKSKKKEKKEEKNNKDSVEKVHHDSPKDQPSLSLKMNKMLKEQKMEKAQAKDFAVVYAFHLSNRQEVCIQRNIPTVHLDEDMKTFTYQASVGDKNGLQLKCGIQGARDIIWKRNGVDLKKSTIEDVEVLQDHSLYIGAVGLHHMGNYSCLDWTYKGIVQTHVLKVQAAPEVQVTPSTQYYRAGSSISIKCHADGIPSPVLSWEVNETPIILDPEHKHYATFYNNQTLQISKADATKDTGAYKCLAKNSAGQGQDIATIFVGNSDEHSYRGNHHYEVFVVFHSEGYHVFHPDSCSLVHLIKGDYKEFKKDAMNTATVPETLCQLGVPCTWGAAVNVKNRYVYASQPELNRVVVIDIKGGSNPVQVIPTDFTPVELQYVEHLDEVWVLCWNSKENTSSKTVVVIRKASEEDPHHAVHTRPVGDRFDLVQNIFLPTKNDFNHHFDYGYVVHNEQQGLHKIHLKTMKYVKTVDFTKYSCVPQNLAFVPLGGYVVVDCRSPAGKPPQEKQLLMDYITDAVINERDVIGQPYVSPDSRYIVSVDNKEQSVTIQRVSDEGQITYGFKRFTGMRLSDVAFYPSLDGKGYDMFATSKDHADMLFLDLEGLRMEVIEGIGETAAEDKFKWGTKNRVITSGGVFGDYLMSPSTKAAVIIDGRNHHVHCEWPNIKDSAVVVWVEPMHL